jgi:hypothetical protein
MRSRAVVCGVSALSFGNDSLESLPWCLSEGGIGIGRAPSLCESGGAVDDLPSILRLATCFSDMFDVAGWSSSSSKANL